MIRILSMVIVLALSTTGFANDQRERQIMEKCSGLGHWATIRCFELENRGLNGLPLPTHAVEQYRSLADLSKVKNPVVATQVAIEHGRSVFYQYCYECHGMAGKGNGPAAEFVGRPVKDLTDANVLMQDDGVLFWKITEGNQPRPMVEYRAFLNEEDVWDTINYIRSLSTEKK